MRPSRLARAGRPLLTLVLAVLGVGVIAAAVTAGPSRRGPDLLYPNLKTLPPEDLLLDTGTIDGATHHLLRFSNTVWNAGRGPLEIQGDPESSAIYQVISAKNGETVRRKLPDAAILYHPTHSHDHFQNFARYELWDLNPNGKLDKKLREGQKTSFCILDTRGVDLDRPGSTPGGTYHSCERSKQGLSVGWGDEYDNTLPDQWIDLGLQPLPDGRYALRSIADARDLLNEGGGGRESEQSNKAATCFAVVAGEIMPRAC